MIDNLRYAAAALAEAGLTLLIEPVNHYDNPGYLLTRSADALAVIEDHQQVFGGTCRHGLNRTAGGFKIQWKRVNLTNSDSMLDGISAIF